MKCPTGTEALDSLLEGGIESDTITIIYGPGGSGKTNFCLHAAIATVLSGKKVVYIDTEGGFSSSRLYQLVGTAEDILKNILFLRPVNFEGQQKAVEKLKDMIDEKIGLVVVDSIAMLYRLEIGKTRNLYSVNRELGWQIGYLATIARKKNIPILMTNQVYSAMDGTEQCVMVGGDLLKYQSKCLIELQKLHSSRRVAILRKHRSLPEDKNVVYEIKEKGIILTN